MIAAGLLDRRLRFYERQDSGADGFSRPVWVFTVERWGRIDVQTNATATPSGQSHREQRLTAAVTVDDGVEVPALGLVRDANDASLTWTITGVVPLRQLRCQRVTVAAVDPQEVATFAFADPVETLDGLHLIETRG